MSGLILCISGIGTDVGKTYITCKIAQVLSSVGRRFVAIKPIASGIAPDALTNSDVDLLTKVNALGGITITAKSTGEASGGAFGHSGNRINLYSFSQFLSPNIAAKRDGVSIDYGRIIEFCISWATRSAKEDFVLVIETAGGVMSPISDHKTTIDLLKDLYILSPQSFRHIMVSRAYLGSVSHTLTAISSAKYYQVPINEIVVNFAPGSNNDAREEIFNTIAQMSKSIIEDVGVSKLNNGESADQSFMVRILQKAG